MGLGCTKERLNKEAQLGQCHVQVMKHFKYTMFCLLAYMCFGDKFDEKVIGDIEDMERNIILSLSRFNLLGAFPKLTKMLMPKRWEELHELINNQERVFVPLIRARKEKQRRSDDVVAYVDTLLNLSVPSEEGGVRKLSEKEIATLCTEFFNAAADTTSTTMEWIMANLVKYPKIQEKLYSEIQGVVSSRDGGDEGDDIKDEELHKMKYLKAVVLEGLRRHPPAHVGIPHAVKDDVLLEGHLVPRDAIIIFTIAEMGWDPTVWEDPMEFKPERFLVSEMGGLDITGTREIKMMPFGAGRRICPGLSFGMQLLEYLVVNLVKDFKWTARMGDDVDLSEKIELTSIMKHPLQKRGCRSRLNQKPASITERGRKLQKKARGNRRERKEETYGNIGKAGEALGELGVTKMMEERMGEERKMTWVRNREGKSGRIREKDRAKGCRYRPQPPEQSCQLYKA
ncbi:hypothetical protein Sjap_004028 [Stephania japonica]|uniref:Cytochrome P450 n=1 Tax=Stephania japonica TaxID=461633 RepID=A0AAP0K2H0_9MAGN